MTGIFGVESGYHALMSLRRASCCSAAIFFAWAAVSIPARRRSRRSTIGRDAILGPAPPHRHRRRRATWKATLAGAAAAAPSKKRTDRGLSRRLPSAGTRRRVRHLEQARHCRSQRRDPSAVSGPRSSASTPTTMPVFTADGGLAHGPGRCATIRLHRTGRAHHRQPEPRPPWPTPCPRRWVPSGRQPDRQVDPRSAGDGWPHHAAGGSSLHRGSREKIPIKGRGLQQRRLSSAFIEPGAEGGGGFLNAFTELKESGLRPISRAGEWGWRRLAGGRRPRSSKARCAKWLAAPGPALLDVPDRSHGAGDGRLM